MSKLVEPFERGSLALRNRVAMAPMRLDQRQAGLKPMPRWRVAAQIHGRCLARYHAVIGGNIRLSAANCSPRRRFQTKWRAVPDEDEHYEIVISI